MSNELTQTNPNAIAGEEVVQDLKLAEALGYKRPTDIRKLIKRHAPLLEGMGLLRHGGAPIISGKGRVSTVTEYHLNRAQTAFIIAKAGTKQADIALAEVSEVFALFSEGGLVAANGEAQASLDAIEERARQRRIAHAEEMEARSDAFKALSQHRSPVSKRKLAKSRLRAAQAKADRERGL